MDAEMREVVAEAVRAEMAVFVQHMRETAVPGTHYDDWLRDGLDWYLEREKGAVGDV